MKVRRVLANSPLVIPAKAGVQGFPLVMAAKAGIQGLPLVIPAKAGIQGFQTPWIASSDATTNP